MVETITRYVECTKWGVLDIDSPKKRGGSLETPTDSRSGIAQTRRGPHGGVAFVCRWSLRWKGHLLR